MLIAMSDHWFATIVKIAFVGSWLLRLWAKDGAEDLGGGEPAAGEPVVDEWRRGTTDTGDVVLWRPRGVPLGE